MHYDGWFTYAPEQLDSLQALADIRHVFPCKDAPGKVSICIIYFYVCACTYRCMLNKCKG